MIENLHTSEFSVCIIANTTTHHTWTFNAHTMAKFLFVLSGVMLKCDAPDCKFTTHHKWTLKAHTMAKHVEDKRFVCHLCGYQTSNTTSFKNHTKLHLGQKDFKCSQCNFRGMTKQVVVNHMRSHTQEKIYYCDRCRFSTGYGYALRRHLMVHLGVRPWQCSTCGYNNITKRKVVKHIQSKHSDAEVIHLGMRLDIDFEQFKKPGNNRVTYVYQYDKEPDLELSMETNSGINHGLGTIVSPEAGDGRRIYENCTEETNNVQDNSVKPEMFVCQNSRKDVDYLYFSKDKCDPITDNVVEPILGESGEIISDVDQDQNTFFIVSEQIDS